MKTTTISTVCLMTLCISALPGKASDEVDPALSKLHRDITIPGGKGSTADAEQFAARFKAILAKEDFTATPDAALRIGMCGDIAQRLAPSLKSNVPGPSAQSSELIDAINQFLEKVSSNIDEGWTFQRGTANVAPPAGVPNAVAGMNPNAISDPKLRKEYVGKIDAERAKQSRNNQQTALRRAREKLLWSAVGLMPSPGQPGWTADDLKKHFAKDDKSRAVLDDYLKKSGRSDK